MISYADIPPVDGGSTGDVGSSTAPGSGGDAGTGAADAAGACAAAS